MKLPDKMYDILKWFCLIALPAVVVLVITLGRIWGVNTTQIAETITAFEVFLGALIGVSCYNYNKDNKTE